MTKQLKLMALASAVLLLGACADETVLNPEQARDANPESNAIQFGTYMGKAGVTRAGQAGSYDTHFLQGGDYGKTTLTNWSETKAKAQGFGVFAYYTGINSYNEATTYVVKTDGTTGQTAKRADFMYNQLVYWNNTLGDDYITKWEYTPVKYWPNEVTNAADGVDDQDNDTNSDPATTSYTKGGNLSFFAYAPYVTVTPSTGTPSSGSTTEGITAITANNAQSDPIITYVVPAKGSEVVDLLWGTYGATSSNVNGGATNAGVAYNASGTNYQKSILPHGSDGYKMNADLTKQKTNGTVGIAFKHALAKVGGSTVDPSNPDPSTSSLKNGLMVILDIDDMKGAEVGGSKDASTKVTVKSITVVSNSLVKDASNNKPGDATYTPTYLTKAEGKLNLATGNWQVTGTPTTTASDAATNTSIINQNGDASSNKYVSGELNEQIKEPASWNSTWASNPIGVETTAKNVYKNEAAPLVFIPNTYPELTITIDYFVRTEDTNLSTGYSEVEQIITKKLTFTSAVELNKQYSILMHLGLTSVKFTATVDDWELNSDATPSNNDFDQDGDGVNDIIVEDVWLPINVAGLRTTYSSTEIASNVSSLTLSTATLWDYATKTETDVKSSVILTVSNHAPAWQGSTWLKAADTPDNTVTLTANTTFTDRTADITATYTVGTNNITNVTPITQKGRIAEKAKVTFTGITDITTAVKAGESKTYTAITVTADGKESDGSTAIGSFAAVNENEIGSIVFKDNNGVAVSWITYNKATKTITIAPNTTGAAREANMFIYVGGKLVPVKNADDSAQIKLTQAAS